MDHHPIIENKPLSYGTWETVLKHMDLKTRQKIHRQIPSCKSINSRIPFILDTVHFVTSNVLKINGITWTYSEHRVHIQRGYGRMIQISMPEEKLFNEYFKNGTRIRKLSFESFPKLLRGKNPKNFQIYVRELRISQDLLRITLLKELEKLQPYIHDSIPLKKCTIDILRRNEPILESPLIQTCSELYLKFHGDIVPSEVQFQGIENMHLTAECERSGRVVITDIVMIWKSVRRPLGSTLTIPVNNAYNIWEAIDYMNPFFGGNRTILRANGYVQRIRRNAFVNTEIVLCEIEVMDEDGAIRPALKVSVEQRPMD